MKSNLIYRYAKKLYSIGMFKLAGDVVDMFSKRKQHNDQVLKDMKKEDQGQSILEQRDVDRMRMSPDNLALTYPSNDRPSERRYSVSVLYPSFDDKGAPFFDEEDGVEEELSVTEDELNGFKEEETQGYIKILNIAAKIPKE